MTVLLGAAIAALASAAFAYLFNGLARHREAAGDALVAALRDANRSQFVLDLDNPDHAALIAAPLQSWRHFVATLVEEPPTDQLIVTRAVELLEWRMSEREARLRFVVTASGRSVRRLAEYHRVHALHRVSQGAKSLELVERRFDDSIEQLVETIRAMRLPAPFQALHVMLRRVPLVRDRLVADADIRMLIADYSERRPPTHLSLGFARLIGLEGS